MAGYCGLREMGDVAVRNACRIGDLVGQAGQPRARYQPDAGNDLCVPAYGLRSFFDASAIVGFSHAGQQCGLL